MVTTVFTRMSKSQTMRLFVLPFLLKDGVTRDQRVKNAMHGNAESTAKRVRAVVAQSADWRMF
jgi:hypothetical protein